MGEADALYEAVREDDQIGRERRVVLENGEVKVLCGVKTNPTVADLCNHFLTAKTRKKDAGELSPRMFAEYRTTTDRMAAAFGKHRPVDRAQPAPPVCLLPARAGGEDGAGAQGDRAVRLPVPHPRQRAAFEGAFRKLEERTGCGLERLALRRHCCPSGQPLAASPEVQTAN